MTGVLRSPASPPGPWVAFYEAERPKQFECEAEAMAERERAARVAPDCERRIMPVPLAYHAPDLLERLIVACDWLADKGVPADHVEMVRIREAIAQVTP